jgi:MFS family permease
VIQSSVAIVNTVLPVLGGIFVDAFGTIPGSLITTLLITSGNILVALSISSTNLTMLILGRLFYGIGSGTVVIVQETILSQWFRGRSLAAVVALMLTVSRLASFLAQAMVVPIANWSGWYGYGFWVSSAALFLFFSNPLLVVLGDALYLLLHCQSGVHCPFAICVQSICCGLPETNRGDQTQKVIQLEEIAVPAPLLLADCCHGVLPRWWMGLLFAYQQVSHMVHTESTNMRFVVVNL